MSEPRRQTGRAALGPRLALAAASILVSLIGVELLLRLAWQNPFSGEAPDRVVWLRAHHSGMDRSYPSWDPELPGVRFRTDEEGFIFPSRRFEAPDAEVVFLGGSTTECGGLLEDARFPARVSYLLEERGLRVATLNAARSGNTTHDSLNVLVNHVVRRPPDVAAMMHASNDIGLLSLRGDYQDRLARHVDLGGALRWPLQAASSSSSVLGLLRAFVTFNRGAPHREDLPSPEIPESRIQTEYVPRLRAFVRVAQSFGIRAVLMTQPSARFRTELSPSWMDDRAQDRFNAVIREVAVEEGATLIDLDRHVRTSVEGWEEPGVVFYDGLHVSESGALVYARVIADALEPLLRASGVKRER